MLQSRLQRPVVVGLVHAPHAAAAELVVPHPAERRRVHVDRGCRLRAEMAHAVNVADVEPPAMPQWNQSTVIPPDVQFVTAGTMRDANSLEEIFIELNRVGYDGAVSIEWEDNDAEQHAGAKTALANARRTDNPPSGMRHDEMLKG